MPEYLAVASAGVPWFGAGTLAARPPAGQPGRLYLVVEVADIYISRDTGVDWRDIRSGEAAAQILAKLLTVDGAGSGLDADTLDGIDSAGFAGSTHNHDATYVNESDHTKAVHDALLINAATLDGVDSTGFALVGDTRFHTRNHNLFSSDHPDVNAADAPANAEVLTYNGTAGKWESAAPGALTVPDASETVSGKVELATATETQTGTDGTRAVHPAGLKAAEAEGIFSAYQSVAQASIPTNTNTKVVFDAEEWDDAGWFAAGTGASQGRYTPLRAGYYEFSSAFRLAEPAVSGSRLQFTLYKNGVQLKHIALSHTSGTAGQGLLVSGGCYAQANGSTDYFELWAWHNYGVSRAVLAGAENIWFQGRLVRRM